MQKRHIASRYALDVLLSLLVFACSGPGVDCDALDPAPARTAVSGAVGHNGLAFDAAGHLVGTNGESLVRARSDGSSELWVPDISAGEQMDFLPNGDLAFVDSGGDVLRVTPDGNATLLVEGDAYGLIVGPDGFIYTSDLVAVRRIDPETGASEVYVDSVALPKLVNWSPELDTLYIGTALDEDGAIWALDVDPDDLRPTSSPRRLTTLREYGWQDSLAVDVCGNLYVAEFQDSALWRITPDAERTVLVEFDPVTYGHGAVWGSGVDGWDATSLYVPHPNDGHSVSVVAVGVPGRQR